MNPQNGWDNVRDAKPGIPLWKKRFLQRKELHLGIGSFQNGQVNVRNQSGTKGYFTVRGRTSADKNWRT